EARSVRHGHPRRRGRAHVAEARGGVRSSASLIGCNRAASDEVTERRGCTSQAARDEVTKPQGCTNQAPALHRTSRQGIPKTGDRKQVREAPLSALQYSPDRNS